MDNGSLKIDKEFSELLPPLSKEQIAELEQLIDQHGWNEPLIYWEGHDILIDGHHRYRIWERDYRGSKLPGPKLVGMHFDTRAEVMEWMVAHQRSRRNWTREERDEIIRKLYEEEVKTEGRPSKTPEKQGQKTVSNDTVSEKPPEQQTTKRTREKVAEATGVSPATVARAVSQNKKPKPTLTAPDPKGFRSPLGQAVRFLDKWASHHKIQNKPKHKAILKHLNAGLEAFDAVMKEVSK